MLFHPHIALSKRAHRLLLEHRGRGTMLAFVLASALVQSLVGRPARADDRVTDWSTPSDEQCVPTCRDGYECHRGECTPICNPVCGPGLLCAAGGECVRVESYAPPARVTRSGASDACFPTCRVGYTCLDGACVSVCNPICARGEVCSASGECLPDRDAPESYAALDPAPRQRPHDPLRDAIVALHIDVLGALQFGLTPTVEVGKRFSGYASLRALNTGMSSYLVLGREREDEFRWGVGGTLGMHVFSAQDGNLRGFYGGPSLEYIFLDTRDVKRDFASYDTHVLLPEADFGYRWAFGRFLVGVGVRLALAIPLADRAEPLGSMGCRRRQSCHADLDVGFLPGLALDLGTFIPRRED